MSLREKFTSWLNSDEIKPLLETEEKPEATPENSAETEKPQTENPVVEDAAKIETEKANLAAEREKVFADKAKVFADAEVAANRLLPAERDSFESSYLQALKDDAASPLADGTRAAQLEAMQSKRQPHHFTAETIAPDATKKVLVGEASEDDRLSQEVDAQVEGYINTVSGKSNFKVVK